MNSIYRFPRGMTFFTTPELLEIGGLPFVTPYEKPTQREALRYYRRVADTHRLRCRLGERVESIVREGDGFAVATAVAAPGRGARADAPRRNVVVATGYYDHPNSPRDPRRGPPARLPLLRRAARLLPPAGSWWSAARTPPPRRRSSSSGPAPS